MTEVTWMTLRTSRASSIEPPPSEKTLRQGHAAQRPRDEPPGQPRLVSRQTQPQAGRVGSIELLGGPESTFLWRALARPRSGRIYSQVARLGSGWCRATLWALQAALVSLCPGRPGIGPRNRTPGAQPCLGPRRAVCSLARLPSPRFRPRPER